MKSICQTALTILDSSFQYVSFASSVNFMFLIFFFFPKSYWFALCYVLSICSYVVDQLLSVFPDIILKPTVTCDHIVILFILSKYWWIVSFPILLVFFQDIREKKKKSNTISQPVKLF